MPNDQRDNIETARSAYSAGDLDRAEQICRDLISENATNVAALHLYGALALCREQPAEALMWLERAAVAGGDDAALQANFGEAYRQLGRVGEARHCLEQALQTDNSNPAPHFNLAKLYRTHGEPRLAEHFYRNVLMLDRSFARAHFELAELYRAEGHLAEAEFEYRASIDGLRAGKSKSGGSEDFHRSQWNTGLGSLLRERGATIGAIEVLRAAVSLDANNASAHLELAKCMFELCWEDAARTHYGIASSLNESAGILSGTYCAARVARPKEWCERRGEQFTVLARAQWLGVPDLHTLPVAAQSRFFLGQPVTSEAYVATIPRARVLPRQFSVLSDDSCLFLDGIVNRPQSFLQNGEGVRHTSDDLRVMLDIPKLQLDVDSVCALLGGSGDHYSWMFETLARLWVLEQHPLYKDLIVIIPEDLPEIRRAMLHTAGVDRNRVLNLPLHHSLLAKQLVVPSLMTVGHWVSPLALQYLRRKYALCQGGSTRRVFLSRSSAAYSRLQNQEELLPILLRHGFEVIDCVGTPPLELIAVLSGATVVISCDDDALANLVVAPQGTKVGVILSEGSFQARALYVCAQLGHSLTYLIAQPDFETNELHSRCNISLLPTLLTEYLEGL